MEEIAPLLLAAAHAPLWIWAGWAAIGCLAGGIAMAADEWRFRGGG
jgi:hypothetical protein